MTYFQTESTPSEISSNYIITKLKMPYQCLALLVNILLDLPSFGKTCNNMFANGHLPRARPLVTMRVDINTHWQES